LASVVAQTLALVTGTNKNPVFWRGYNGEVKSKETHQESVLIPKKKNDLPKVFLNQHNRSLGSVSTLTKQINYSFQKKKIKIIEFSMI